ncbi:MAG: SUF system Fe-S cluster assembly regulator [Alphaproteobacteria bacterium]|nr:SUF system Fe-S cluster assembly regulator [Alphaproteobacteria bacterium]
MFRLNRLVDYGVVLMSHIAAHTDRRFSAPGLASDLGLPVPVVSKVLKGLVHRGLLTSYRGAKGGYRLGREADAITVADIISAIDGPIALTHCIEDSDGTCGIESLCPQRGNWQIINHAVRNALADIRLSDLTAPLPPFFEPPLSKGGKDVTPL